MAGEGAIDIQMALSVMETYRKHFPVLSKTMNGKRLAFLDSAASAQKPAAVIESMGEPLRQNYANIHRGAYLFSQELTASYEAVREKVAGFICAASEKEIVFTANATDSINLVAHSWGRAHLKEGDEIILSEMEHHANIVPWQLLQREIGFIIRLIPVLPNGTLDMGAFQTLLNEKTKLVSVVHVSNALGTINPVKEIITAARAYNPDIKILIDGSQSAVHMPIDVQDMDCDFFVFTAHKLYTTTGVGVLYGKYEILDKMPPYRGGGDMIEYVSFEGTTFKAPPARFEAGTPPIIAVIGLGAAIDYIENINTDIMMAHEREMTRLMTEGLKEIGGIEIYADLPEKAGIVSFNIQGVHSSDVGSILDQCGVAVRTGHHCCMPLLQKLGINSSIRASFALYTNADDINQCLEGLRKAKEMLL
jgi:cysteine desulfurase / selenocysteine lyase